MKTISSRFLKAAVAMLLIVLMIFGSTVSSFAAVVDKADTKANVDLASTNYNISAGVKVYYLDTASWNACQMYIWKSDGYNTYYTLTKIPNTKIYYYNFGSKWEGYQGFKFRSDSNWSKQSANDIKHDITASSWYNGTSTTKHTTLAQMSGAAKVVTMVSTDGGKTYAATASSDVSTKVSGYSLTTAATSASSVDASTSTSTDNASINAAYGSTITYTATPGSHTFKGFSTTNSSTLPSMSSTSTSYTRTATGYSGTANTTVYAYYVLSPKYSVTYDANGGTGAPTASTNLAAGSSHTVSSTVPKYTGYNFKSWNAAADGSGSTYNAGQTITVNSDIILYAQWAKVHTITYNANGGSGAPDNGSAEHGTEYTIPTTAPTKADHNFTGWKDQNGATYAAGDTISAVTSDMTLTAQWELAGVCTPHMDGLTLEIDATDGKVTATTNDFCTGGKTFDYDLVDGDEFITLNDDQTVTPKKPGTAHVKATCACGKEVTCAVTVNEPVLDINPEEVALLIGQSMTEAFKASANVGNPAVTFTSKDESIATVTNGKATAVAEGNVDIEASLKFNDYYTATICAKVSVSTPAIKANPTSVALEFGEGATATSSTVTVETNAAAGNGTGDDVTVTSAKTSVATATISGSTITITATGVGSTTVTAKFHDATVEIPVTVTQYDPYVYLYVTDNNSWGSMYVYSWKGSNTEVTPITTSMIYIGKNGDGQNIFAYRFLKTNLPENVIFAKNSSWGSQTADIPINWTDTNHRALYFKSNSNKSTMEDWTENCMIVRPTVSVADVVVPVGGTETATATVENGDKVLWKSQGTTIATIADVDTQTSTVTGVTPGDTTITARAFVDTANSSIKTLPTNYKTDTACWPFISTEATATVTVGSVDYDITVTPTTGGTASITVDGKDEGAAAKIAHGTEYTLTATANDGYRFVGFYDGETEISTTSPYTTTAKAAVNYTAKFVKTYKVSVLLDSGIDLVKLNNVASAEGFTDIEVDEGATITVYASPKDAHKFIGWTDLDGNTVSTMVNYTLTVNGDLTLTATSVPSYTAVAEAQTNKYFGEYGGTVKINGQTSPQQFLAGETVTFTAEPKTNYYFAGWYSDVEFTNRVSEKATYETTMTEDGITLFGLFVKEFYIKNHDTGEIDVTFKYDIATNSYYSDDTDYVEKFIVTSNDGASVNSTDVTVSLSSCVGLTNVSGHYTSHYVLTPDTENYDIESPVTYTLTPDFKADGSADGTYTLNIALSDAEKVAISVDGTWVADKAIGSTFRHEITPPAGQYLASAVTTPPVDYEIVDGKIEFTVPNSNVNIVPTFAAYAYVEFTDTTGLDITGLKTGYKAGEPISIAVAPTSEQVTISAIEVENDALTVTPDGNGGYTITGTLASGQTVTVTPTVDAKFAVNSQQIAIGNYGTNVTTFGTVTITDADGKTLSEGSYVEPGTVVTYTATANTNYTFVGFYSDGACDQPIKVGVDSTNVTVNADTTVYALFARKQWMTFDQSKTSGSYVKELVYDPSIGAYTLTTTLTTGNSTDSTINTGAWFRVTNNTSKWSTAEGYHVFDASKFTVYFNTNGYGATIGWAATDGSSNAWKLTTGGESGQSIKFILTPNGNESIEFSASTIKEGATIYLSSGTLSLPGTYSSESVFTTTGITVSDSGTLAHKVGSTNHNTEAYKKADIAAAQTIEFKTTLTGTSAADYYVDSYIIYDILDKTYTIVTPNTLGNNAYSGTVYVDSDCYIVPIFFHTDEYLAANNMKAVDVYFDATAIDGTNWGPFVSVYSWGSNGNEYSGVWPGQLMIPTEDGSSFYTQFEVPDADLGNTTSVPQGLQFMNYLFAADTVPSKFAANFGVSLNTIQTYDYREPITLYEEDYDVITFVAKTSEDGYHGDKAAGQSVVKKVTTTTNAKTGGYVFETLVCRDGVTPMDLTGKAIEGTVSNTPDYYVISKGDVTYDGSTKKYAGNNSFDADWAVDWYIFDKDGKYINHTLSTAMWHYADGENDTTSELEDALGLADGVLDGKLVHITYEAPNNSSTQPHQLCYDGQWYGNLLDDDVYADVMVGLVDENGNFVIDTVDPTNDADYGEGWLIAEEERDGYTVGEKYASLPITLDHGEVSLAAATKDGYRFYGWYTESNGKYTRISDAYNYETYINLNTTYYAMFKQIGDDEIVINHLTYNNPNDPHIPSHGGVSQMTVEVVDSKGNVVAEGTPSTSISTAVFVPEYNQDTSTYEKYTVKITTTPLMNGEFFAWYTNSKDADGNDTYEEILVEEGMPKSTTKVQSEFTYEYNDEDPVKVINIYSDVTRVSNKATLFYKYLNRFGQWRTYTVRDVELTDNECLGYAGNDEKQYCPTFITQYVMIKGNDEQTVYGDTEYKKLLEEEYTLKSSYNMVTDYAPSDEVTEAIGKTTEWTITETNITLSKSVVTLEAIQNPEQYTITYTEGNSSEWKTISGSYNDLVQITASGFDGEEWGQGNPFSHWEQYNNETGKWEFLSFERYYNYRIIEDKKIRAVYGNDLVDEWMPRIDSVTYTREYSDNSDYIYTDYLVAFNNVNTLNLNEIKDEQNITYGLVLVQDWNYRYSGTGAVTYPSSSVSNIEYLVTETAKARANYSPDKGITRCYHYDMTDEPTTNLNRLYHYLSYNLNNGKYDYGQFAFTTYAYINVDGKIYISNGMDVNFYELAHEETAAKPTH